MDKNFPELRKCVYIKNNKNFVLNSYFKLGMIYDYIKFSHYYINIYYNNESCYPVSKNEFKFYFIKLEEYRELRLNKILNEK